MWGAQCGNDRNRCMVSVGNTRMINCAEQSCRRPWSRCPNMPISATFANTKVTITSPTPWKPRWNIEGIYSRWRHDMEEFVYLCSHPPPSSSRYYRLIDVGGSKSPASPARAPLLLCSGGHLRVMDELKSLSIRQDRLKGSDNANTHIFSPKKWK